MGRGEDFAARGGFECRQVWLSSFTRRHRRDAAGASLHDTNLGVFSLDPKDSCTVGIPECSPPQDHSEQHLPQISIPQEGLQSYLLRVYLKTLQIRRHRMGPNTNTNTPPTTAAADCVQVPDSTRCSPARGEPSRHRRGTLGPFRGHGGASVAFVRDW